MHQWLTQHVKDWRNVKWTATKCEFLGLGGNFSKVWLIKMCLFAKNRDFHLYLKTQSVYLYLHDDINDIFGWNMNWRHKSGQNLGHLNNFDFFCFLNEMVSIWLNQCAPSDSVYVEFLNNCWFSGSKLFFVDLSQVFSQDFASCGLWNLFYKLDASFQLLVIRHLWFHKLFDLIFVQIWRFPDNIGSRYFSKSFVKNSDNGNVLNFRMKSDSLKKVTTLLTSAFFLFLNVSKFFKLLWASILTGSFYKLHSMMSMEPNSKKTLKDRASVSGSKSKGVLWTLSIFLYNYWKKCQYLVSFFYSYLKSRRPKGTKTSLVSQGGTWSTRIKF